jgi:hypothetical protein
VNDGTTVFFRSSLIIHRSLYIVALTQRDKKKSSHEPTVEESPGIDFTSTYFKIGFWDGLSPKVGGGLFL